MFNSLILYLILNKTTTFLNMLVLLEIINYLYFSHTDRAFQDKNHQAYYKYTFLLSHKTKYCCAI